jgi:fucose 4-O-acetylase-like acetyltransferase
MVTASVVGSLAVGLYQLDYLQLDRVFGFLPFFVLGLAATPEQLERLRGPRVRRAALPVMAGGAVVGALVAWQLPSEWLYYRSGYATLGVSPLEGLAIRSGLLVTSTALAPAFLAWMPRRRTRLTAFGAASLVVYLFHGFVLKAAEYAGFPDWAADRPVLSLVLVTLGCIALSLLLTAPAVARRLSLMVEPTSAVEAIRTRS